MTFISGIIIIIIQKNMLCTNKICVIYFCSNCVNFLPEKVLFFYSSPSPCTYVFMSSICANLYTSVLLLLLLSFFDKICSFPQNTTKSRSRYTQSYIFLNKESLQSNLAELYFAVLYVSFTQYCLYLLEVWNSESPNFQYSTHFCVLQIFIRHSYYVH